MNLNKWLLPTQADNDDNDCLNRCSLVVISSYFKKEWSDLADRCLKFISSSAPIFVRFPEADYRNTSGDQIAGIWCMKAIGYDIDIRNLFFAANTMDTSVGKWKLPIGDFILLRVLPLWIRTLDQRLSFLRHIADICLIWLAISDLLYYRISDDGADCNNTMVSLMTCNRVQPTFISRTVWRLWKQYSDFEKRLRRYHRKEALANPEIAEWLIEAANK